MKLKGKTGIILTIVAGVGVIFTVMVTAKKAPEAQKAKEEALEKKRQETGKPEAQLTRMESIQAQLPALWPVAAGVTMTVGSLVASQIIPQNALHDLNTLHNTYKDISAKVNGEKGEQLIGQMTNQKLTQGTEGIKKETFVLRFNDKDIPFETTMLDVLEAEYDVNRFFCGTGTITFNQLLGFFHQKEVERGDEFGWDQYLGEAWYGYSWIDFKERRGMLDGKPVTFIEFPFDCHSLCEEEIEEEFNNTLVNHGIEGTA